MLKVISPEEVRHQSAAALGLGTCSDLLTPEAIAAALRRAAGFLCPCPRRVLMSAVEEALTGLAEEGVGRERISQVLDAMTAYGDLLEECSIQDDAEAHAGGAVLFYAAPPAFVWHGDSALLLGVVPDHASPLPPDMESRIRYRHHVRRIWQEPGEHLETLLRELGLVELSVGAWLKAPPRETPDRHVARLTDQLRAMHGDLSNLMILNPERPVDYYRGRWEAPRSQSGRFVARRSQWYGNDLWCFVELEAGRPLKILDLPTRSSGVRACDEAWRLQAAIDASRETPQRYRIRSGSAGTDGKTSTLTFYSPVPLWAQRRWDEIGEPVARGTHESGGGGLFSYQFLAADIAEEERFIRDYIWLAPISD